MRAIIQQVFHLITKYLTLFSYLIFSSSITDLTIENNKYIHITSRDMSPSCLLQAHTHETDTSIISAAQPNLAKTQLSSLSFHASSLPHRTGLARILAPTMHPDESWKGQKRKSCNRKGRKTPHFSNANPRQSPPVRLRHITPPKSACRLRSFRGTYSTPLYITSP